MTKRLMLLALAVSLGACGERQAPPPPFKPITHRPPPEQPIVWLAAEPECRGALRRGEWLVCDNANLRNLHRTLANQWADGREHGGRRQLRLIRQQQEALLSERRLCDTTACVATAYRRYLPAQAAPKPRWTPRPARQRYAHYRPNRDSAWYRGAGERSCAAQLGGSAAAYLVRQCRMVNGRGGQCSADRTCSDLEDQIRQGCIDTRRAPGFCRSGNRAASLVPPFQRAR